MIICKNIYFPIGQGGFMYSRIENDTEKTDFIYDCGSKSPTIINNFLQHTCLKSLISPYSNAQKATVDRLYISHFDTDHINGIKDLCTQIDFKKVFFPLYPEGYRLLLALNYIYNNASADANIVKAIYDPENYLRTITGDGEILPMPPIKEAPDLSKIIPQTEKSDHKQTEKSDSKNGYCSYVKHDWILYSFHPAFKVSIDYKTIRNILITKFPHLERFIKYGRLVGNKPYKDKLRQEYHDLLNSHGQISPKGKGKDINLFNQSSLMLYSGSTKSPNKPIYNSFIFSKTAYNNLCETLYCFIRHGFIRYSFMGSNLFSKIQPSDFQYALLLTGDADLRGKNWHGYLNNHQIDLRKNIITTNLPHHGSKCNIDSDTFSGFDNIQNFLTFSQNGKHYGHPNPQAIQSALNAQPNANIIHVDDSKGLLEIIHMKN